MAEIRTLTEEQALEAIEAGIFDEKITGVADNVAIMLTQDWCPEWLFMKTWMRKLKKLWPDDNLVIYTFVYNRSKLFESFMHFKETVYENNLIPFVLYYKKSELVSKTNYVSFDSFKEQFDL